ncbi:hypothetical protein [Pseudomonas sp. TCU-HL1]|uniref:hypothetical protein n=1 Tax=Pseudomonas sp. TCU-HL1 TaxID=1856685 RepID=UPI0008588DE1|nr:transposase subunit [Pseudomonas sp. TCU-HL1]
MKGFIQEEHRGQSTLLPKSLDDYVADNIALSPQDAATQHSPLLTSGTPIGV